MDEVLDEVSDDGVQHRQDDEDGHEQVEDVGRQVDGISGRRYIRFKNH